MKVENENKISSMAGSAHCTEEIMSACALCPRECLADRSAGKKGFCGMDERIYLARAALHMWEEPCISGTKGSGAVFFSGCGLRCCFCQNHDIAIGSRGRAVSVERLGEIFLELKEKLQREGLFDAERKKGIPAFPRAIGIVTSPTGAVIQDIRHVLERRAPWVKAYLLPVRVQGAGAEHEIAAAVRAWSAAPLNGLPPVDVLIVGRGGGSIEDLWNFNEETVARAIYECTVPVISAVGHDTAFTIADFVADLRAPTPTAAAELATPDGPEWLRKLARMEQALHASARHSLLRSKLKLDVYLRGKLLDADSLLSPYAQRLDDMEETLLNVAATRIFQNTLHINKLEHQLQMRHPTHRNRERAQLLASLQAGLAHAAAVRMADFSSQLALIQARLEAHSPEQTLRRGYALVENQNKQLIRQTNQVHAGEKLKVRVSDGCFYVRDDTPQ